MNSLKDIWFEYDLTINLLSSAAAVYVSIIAAYFITVFSLKSILLKESIVRKAVDKLNVFFNYFPYLLAGLILIFIFPASELTEYIFLVLYASFFLIAKSLNPDRVKEEYILAAKSFGLNEKEIVSQTLIKSIQPVIIKDIQELHIKIWTLLIAFELFKEGLGFGLVFKATLENSDFAAFIFISIILLCIISAGGAIIRYTHKKFFPWEL